MSAPDDRLAERREIVGAARRRRIEVDGHTGSITTYHLPEAFSAGLHNPPMQ